MGAVLKFENRSIRSIYLFILSLTVVVTVEALITALRTGESDSLPILLIGSTIGYSLFWVIEFVVWRFFLKNAAKKGLTGIIFISRYTVLGGLLYFLFTSTDIIYAIITCIVYLLSTRFGSKDDVGNRMVNLEVFVLASVGLMFVLSFCIGYFGGMWIGEHFGKVEIGSYIGLVLGFVVALVLGWVLSRKVPCVAQKP